MGLVSQLIASTLGGAVGGSFVLLGVHAQSQRQSEAALRALRVEVGSNESVAKQMIQAWAMGIKDRFEHGKADPGWLKRSIWDSQLPFFVPLLNEETLKGMIEAYATLEAVPHMLWKPNAHEPARYARGGWVDDHIGRIQNAFRTAGQNMDRLQTGLCYNNEMDPWIVKYPRPPSMTLSDRARAPASRTAGPPESEAQAARLGFWSRRTGTPSRHGQRVRPQRQPGTGSAIPHVKQASALPRVTWWWSKLATLRLR
jgi:hypothetical protein